MKQMNRNELLVKLCKLYYLENMTQQQIANELGISRPQISRFLTEARKKGIVQIKICSDSHMEATEIAVALREKYELKNVIVAECHEVNNIPYIAAAAANFISNYLRNGQIIGLSWGSIIARMIDNITVDKELKNSTFVPMVGGMDQAYFDLQINTLVEKISKLFKSNSLYLNAPAYFESVELLSMMKETAPIQKIMDYWNRLEVAIVDIGEIGVLAEDYRSLFNQDFINNLINKGAVGDVFGRFFTREGDACKIESYDDRLFALTIEEIRNIPEVIGVSGGISKAEVIHAAINGKLINSLVTDITTANKLMNL